MKKLLFFLIALCCVFTARSQLVGITVEEIVHDGEIGDFDFTGYTTYRVYAELESDDDILTAVAAYADHTVEVSTTTSFYQNDAGELIGSPCSLVPFVPAVEYDSYLTVGDPCESGIQEVPGQGTVGNPFSPFEDNGDDIIMGDGAWFGTPGNPNLQNNEDNQIMLGQFTTDGDFSYKINVQVLNGGIGAPEGSLRYVWEEPVNEPGQGYEEIDGSQIGCIYPIPSAVPGCTDETACNFDPEATEDDGSCIVVDGGVISTEDETTICAGDGIADPIDVTLEGSEGPNMAWVITDEDGVILDLPAGPPFDFEGAEPGVCLIWNLSFDDGLVGAEVGENANDLEGCFDLSEPIAITREQAGCTDPEASNYDENAQCDDGSCVFPVEGCTDETACNYDPEADTDDGSCYFAIGGEISTDGETLACAGDGAANEISFSVTGNEGPNSAWVVTDTDGVIVEISESSTFDLESFDPGSYLIWHVSFDDGITGAEPGNNADDIEGCYDLSNSIEVTVEEAGCSDEEALNYNPDAECGDNEEFCEYEDGCPEGENSYNIAVGGGSFASEVSWTLSDDEGNAVAGDGAPYDEDVCLADGCYQFSLEDSFGDGWNGNNLVLTDSEGNELFNITLESGGGPELILAPIGGTAEELGCGIVIEGCTDEAACNYNPDATDDDGSCLFVGDSCDDGNDQTTDDAINEDCECEGEAPELANDECEGAIDIEVDGDAVTGDNTFANGSEGEGCWGESDIDNDIWYSFVAPESGDVIIETFEGSNDDSQLAVYDACGGNEVGCNDDGGEGFMSLVTLSCGDYVPGETYFIQVDGWNGASGTFDISVTTEEVEGCTDPEALNYDECATIDDESCEYPLDCPEGESTYSITVGGGSFTGEVSWTLTSEGEEIVSGGAPYDEEICLADGCYQLTLTDSFGDGWNGNDLVITDSEGNELYNVTLEDGAGPQIIITPIGGTAEELGCEIEGCTDEEALNYNPDATEDDGSCVYPVENNECEGAIALATDGVAVEGDNTNADASDVPAGDCWFGTSEEVDNDIWYSFVAPEGGDVIIETFELDVEGANDDTQLQVFESCDSEEAIACSEDEGEGLMSLLTLTCDDYVPGETYYIQVDGWNGVVGPFDISITIDQPNGLGVTCPEDAIAECGGDFSPEALGEPVTDACAGLEYSFEDEIIEGDSECSYSIERTFFVVGPTGEETTCVQNISVVDTEGPVFPEIEDITVSCIEDVPAQEELTATDECSGLEYDADTFESETGFPIDSCVLSVAEGLGADWAVWLPSLAQDGAAASANFNWVDGGTFIAYNDGTAHIYGTVENEIDPNQSFEVSIWLENSATWSEWSALGRSYKDDANLAGTNYEDWTYYELVNGFSTLTGTNDYAGNTLYLEHMPSDYYFGWQCGLAANNKNANEGLSGWFTYTGVVNGEFVDGHGDVNVDKDCETPNNQPDCINDSEVTYFWRAVDDCGNETIASQTITVSDEIGPEFTVFPEDMTVECDELPVPVFEGIEAVDNCAGDVSIEYVGESQDGDGCEYTLTRTWIATDICDNSTLFEQVITVVDSTAPEFTFVPEDATYECSDEFDPGMAEAIDNCSEDVTISVEESVEGDGCEDILTRVFTADDGCGNLATATQIITLVDTTAPVIELDGVDITAECGETDMAFASATDNCNEVTLTWEDQLQSGGCVGVLVRTYTADDGCGNVSTATQYITLEDNEAPVLNGVPEDMTVECDEIPEAPVVTAVDACEGEVEVNVTEEIIEGDCPENYTIVWTWSASDLCENSVEASASLTVQDTTDPEFVEFPEDMTVECDEELGEPVFPVATDNCDEDVEIELTETEEPGECPNSYTISRVFRGFDNCGNEVMQVQTITVVDTTAPEFTSVPEDVTIECDEEVPSMMAEASDNCGAVSVTSEDEVSGGSDDCPQSSTITRTFTAEDECGNTSTAVQVISIVDTTAPVIEGEIEVDMPCDMVDESILVEASDNCGEVSLSYEDESVSGGCAGRIIRLYTAVDECGNVAEFEQIISLIDEVAPEFTLFPEDVTVNCDEIPSIDGIEVAYEDNCSDTLDLVFDGEEIVGEGCEYQIVRTWTLTDPCENATTAVWTITVVDDEAPVISGEDFEETVSCDSEIDLPQYEVSDNCDDDVELDMSMETIDGDCPQNYTEVYTWTATDDCGNSSERVATINYVDEEAPVFTSVPNSNELSCEEELPTEMATAEDNCGEVTVTFNDVIEEGECPNSYTVVRTFTAADECGNTATESTSYFIYDITAPVFDGEVEDVVVECADDVPAVADVSATDNCGEATVTSSTEVLEEDDCGNSVSIVTLVATDECGNTAEISYSVTVEDTTAPELVDAPEDLVLDCQDDVPAAPEVSAVDNCDEFVEVSYTEEFIGEDEPAEGSSSDCVGTNPQGVTPAWSLWLQDFENGLDYYELQDGETASWITYPDGTAHLTGTVYSTEFPDRGFVIDVWFENGMDWDSWSTQSFPTSYKDDNGFAEDDMLWEDWTYYIMNSDSATLTGVDDYAGSFLTLSHAPSSLYFGFQEGEAANNRSVDYGIGGWFYYEGTLNGPDYEGPVDGAGDFAFELDCCPQYEIVRTWTATDCSGNVTTHTQTITFDELPEDPTQDPTLEDSAYDAQKGDLVINGLAPNPSKNVSYLEFTSKSNQQVTIAISDMAGNQIDVVFEGNVEAGVDYRQQLNTTHLESGLYLVRLVGSADATYTKLVVGK